jgi:hypothetical protein
MFKNLIAPVQAWLMSQKRCVGCGMPLVKARSEKLDEGREKVVCKCHRIYVHTLGDNKFRRAKMDEV